MLEGKPDKNYRYFYTKVDKRPQFVIANKCNHCPFLLNKNGNAICGRFINSSTNSSFIKGIYSYVQRRSKMGKVSMEILTPINIPEWCELPNHISNLSPNDNINYIKNGKLYTESGENYAYTITIISDEQIELSDEDLESYVTKKVKSKYVTYNKEKNTYNKTSNICSSCGEDKKSVKRDKNYGMCDKCWDKFKFSYPRRYNAKINNFRLKRKENWKKEEFKKI